MIYIGTFAISLLFIKLSMTMKKKNLIIGRIFEVIGILIPCILASLRDYTIGTDVKVYVSPFFNIARGASSFIDYYNSIANMNDILYLFVTYICAHISNDIGLLFFVNEMLVILPIYIALKNKFKDKNENCIILGMLLFYLFFYNQSYNIVRQSIAISFIILGLSFLDEGKNKKFLLCLLIACMFHNTANFFVLILAIYKILVSKKINKKVKFIIEILLLGGGMLCVIFLPNLMFLVPKLNILSSSKIEDYTRIYIKTSADISYLQIVVYLYVLLIIFMYKKRIEENEKNADYYVFSTFLSLIILQCGSIISYAERIGYYIFYPLVITMLPYAISKEKNKKNITKNDFIVLLSILIMFIIYWWLVIYVKNFNETYPYILR